MKFSIPKIDHNWCIIEDVFDITKNRHYESVFSLGTGYMTTRASIEEGFQSDDQSIEYDRRMDNTTLEKTRESKSRWGTFMPVIQANHPNLNKGIVNLPFYLGLIIVVDDEKLDLEHSNIHDYCRWLDLQTGTLYRRITWKTHSGKQVKIAWRRYMNPKDRFACVQDVNLIVDQPANVIVESYLDSNVRTNGFDKFIRYSVGAEGELIYSDVQTNLENRIVTASQCFYNLQNKQKVSLTTRKATSNTSFYLGKNEMLEICKISFTAADTYFPANQLLEIACSNIQKKGCEGSEILHKDHTAAWAELWRTSDIQILAKDTHGYNSQLAIRAAIFHLLKAKGLEDRALLCPKGSTTEMYYGSVFWDFEIFILPFFIYTHPELARTAPAFRYNGLDPARKLARAYGYGGAKYPWQSDCTGNETCVPWQYADHQVHIAADVALGVWHYVSATNDKKFLYEKGAEILIETARYWLERVDSLTGKPGLHILGVMGPDEYKPMTNNNAYTNFVARLNIQLAADVAAELKQNDPEQYVRLCRKIGLRDCELTEFGRVAALIAVPQDDDRHIIWQCDDFDTSFAEIDINGIWTDRTRLFGFYVSQEKRYRSKVIKQADVLALLGVFPYQFTPEQKAASFNYYEPFTIHDSSNSITHRQMVAADLGWADVAYESWLKAIDIDFGSLPRSNDGLHYANVGGMWQQVVFGFAGLASALNEKSLMFKPCLPKQIQSIMFPLIWKGQVLRVTVSQKTLQVENLSQTDLEFWVSGQLYKVEAGQRAKAEF
ncbi:MAG: glycoside hydrolase family 65 protein [Anaerolineaceae bacterium]|nr:glycoside hydrolase family 65 protein [Anaerolineaceae bacterium]